MSFTFVHVSKTKNAMNIQPVQSTPERLWRIAGKIGAMVVVCLTLASCSSVPKEVVELSYALGQDIEVMRASYKMLIHQHYDALRSQRQRYLDQEWKPVFVKAWIADGHLVQMASGKEVYSSNLGKFVAPSSGKESAQLLEGVSGWAEDAIEQISKKRSELMAPLDSEEKELATAVDEAFQRISRGNAAITAHLNSLRKVQEIQDEFLKAFDLKDLRSIINDKLANASDRAEKALSAVRDVDRKLGETGSAIQGAKKAKSQ